MDFKIKRVEVDGVAATLNIWDTAGQERFRNITKSFYKGAHGIVLVYSITDPESFEHIERWIDQIKESGSFDTEMILVGSKSDLKTDRKVSYEAASELAGKYNVKLIEVSAKENRNIDEVFEELTHQVIGNKDLTKPEKEKMPLDKNAGKKKKKDDCC